MIYALLDGASSIELDHLKAALALWDYAARGAEWALGDTTGVPLAEQLYRTLSDDPDELSRSQLRDSLNRNYPAAQVLEALESLERDGRAKRRMRKNPNGGRPAEALEGHYTRDGRYTAAQRQTRPDPRRLTVTAFRSFPRGVGGIPIRPFPAEGLDQTASRPDGSRV